MSLTGLNSGIHLVLDLPTLFYEKEEWPSAEAFTVIHITSTLSMLLSIANEAAKGTNDTNATYVGSRIDLICEGRPDASLECCLAGWAR